METDTDENKTDAVDESEKQPGDPADLKAQKASDGLPGDLAKERKLRQQYEKELNDLKAAQLSEGERAVKERDELKSAYQEADLERKRLRIALELKMPWSLAKRIQGDDDAAMQQDAKELMSSYAQPADKGERERSETGRFKPATQNDAGKGAGGSSGTSMNDWLRSAAGYGPSKQ